MNEPQRLASLLTDGTDLAAAALLVAMCDDNKLETSREDADLIRALEVAGRLSEGCRTPLNNRVALVVRAAGIRPWPGALA